jgi:NADPH-dependent curcumin reductase
MIIPPHSTPSRNRRVLLVERPTGIPQADHFRLDEAPVEAPAEGEALIRNLYLSVDPAQRGWAADVSNYAAPVPLGTVMRALGVGIVLESRIETLAPDDIVYGWTGWQDVCRLDMAGIITSVRGPDLPVSLFAGILGINGMTAWLALERLGRPAEGETLLVTTAAGAVGSVVGQLGRAEGCRVLGLAGSDDKVGLCVDRFGYDAAFNYRAPDWRDALALRAPEGIDIFFDNVGGGILDSILRRMRVAGRIIQCGTASIPSWEPPPRGPRNEREILSRRLSWNGFVIFDHKPAFAATIARLAALVREGKLAYDEDIESGIEAAPDALRQVYAGENHGKKLIFIG